MDPNVIAPAVLVSTVMAIAYAVRMRQITKPSGQALSAGEQKVSEIFCESSVRLRGFLVFGNASHTKLILTDRRLLLCSRDERQVRLALRPEDLVNVERLQSGLLGKVPGLLIDYLEDGRERRARFQAPENVGVLALMGDAVNPTTRDQFLECLERWRERHRVGASAAATA